MAVSVGVASLVASTIPHPVGVTRTVFWWIAVLGTSTLALYGAERAARRFLPLAALLKMTMLFPDKAPSRLGVALRSGTTKDLERRLDIGQLASEEPTAAAAEILALAGALSAHDRQTRGHSERVRAITDMIAEELELPAGDRDRLRWSALLHDIGKLTVHSEVLNKTEKLSDADWDELKRHPLEGARLIAPLSSWLGDWSLTVAQHHEKHDGTGYPYGLAGDEISLGARIVAVADSFEVMTAARAYKRPSSPSWARQELTRCAGTQFDPVIVRAFLNISIGRLRRAMGPISWLVDAPVVSQFEHLGQAASVGSRTALLATAVGASAFAASSVPVSDAMANPVHPAQVLDHSRVPHLAVAKGSQTITFTSSSSSPRVGGTYPLRATGGDSGNVLAFSIASRTASVCSISASVVSFLGAGSCIIDANQPGNVFYDAAPQAHQTVIVRPGDTTIDVVGNDAAPGGTLVFTASVSGLPGGPGPIGSVTWAVRAPDGVSTPCSSVGDVPGGSTVTFTCSIDDVGAGTYSAVATYRGDGNYQSGVSSDKNATIDAAVISQDTPTTGTVSTTRSATFTDQLSTGGPLETVRFVTTSENSHLSISSSGAIATVGTLAAGSYKASGTDSTALGAAGTWSYTLTVDAAVISQDTPTTGTVSTTRSSSFTGQLATSGQTGAVSFAITSANSHLSVSSSGAITTAGGTLAAASYTVSGTASDGYGDTGTWSYTLSVGAVAISQVAPTAGSVSTSNSAGFSDQLATSGQNGAVSFVTTSPNANVAVSSSGVVTTTGTLAAASYTVSGTASDGYGDTGTWGYTLTVSAVAISQAAPTIGGVSTTNSASLTGQLATSGQNGAVSFVTGSPNAYLLVASSGAITTAGGILTAGSYTVSGTDSDAYGDTGTWSYTLTVNAVAISQAAPLGASESWGILWHLLSPNFTAQLVTNGQNGAVTFVTTSPNANLVVSSSGAITTAGILGAGSYTVSGTDRDTYGDSGTWSYTLSVGYTTINQNAPTAGSVATTNSASFTGQLATDDPNGAVNFVTTSPNAHVRVSSSGAITTTGTLAPGIYAVSGTDTDSYGGTGTWSYTLTVAAVPITQVAPTTGSVSTTNSATFTGQLATNDPNTAVSFVTTAPNAHVSVSSSGAITTTGSLAAGSYTVSGTDSDAYGGTGTWSYTLTVTAVTITQGAPTTGSVSTTNSASFTAQLATSGANGAVSFVTTSPNANLAVSSSGAITTAGTLPIGGYTVSGTDADAYGDTGSWSYTLTVHTPGINQGAPTAGSVSTTNSASFTDQLATDDPNPVNFVRLTSNAYLNVSASGVVTATGTLAAGVYTVSGTDADAALETGTWSFTLTVTAVTISQAAPVSATVSTANSATFTDQLATSGQTGGVTFVTTAPNASLGVSSVGTITTGGTLAVGTYTVSGTDSDAYGDTGTWTYILTVQ